MVLLSCYYNHAVTCEICSAPNLLLQTAEPIGVTSSPRSALLHVLCTDCYLSTGHTCTEATKKRLSLTELVVVYVYSTLRSSDEALVMKRLLLSLNARFT